MSLRREILFQFIQFNIGEKRRTVARRILLVVHNCWLNGMANIYLHNNLEIFSKTNHGHEQNGRKKSLFEEDSTADSIGDPDISLPEIDNPEKNSMPETKTPHSSGIVGPICLRPRSHIDSIEEEDEDIIFEEDGKVEDESSKQGNSKINGIEDKPTDTNITTEKESAPKKDYR